MTPTRRILTLTATALLAAGLLGGCHFAGHVPPGQAKKLVVPPPGQSVPPGHRR